MHKKKNTILIVDDEMSIRKMLSVYLSTEEYKIEEAENGKQAVRLSASIKPDMVLLDLGLPDIDGKEVIAAIRKWSHMPIIVLSARPDDKEIVAALDAGADDFIQKPFGPEILLSRIRANLRKGALKEVGEPKLTNGPITMDMVRHEVFLNNEQVSLTPKEYDLLRYFIIHRGKMLTHQQLLKEIWGAAHGDDMQYLRVYIRQLREKLEEDPASPKLIITAPGIGYRMELLQLPILQMA
jgi:two-component system KDP operon response regulator KdpE